MPSKQLLCLLIAQLLPEGGQQVAQLCRADETIPILHFIILTDKHCISSLFQINLVIISDNRLIFSDSCTITSDYFNCLEHKYLVKVPEAFNEVVTGISGATRTYCLKMVVDI